MGGSHLGGDKKEGHLSCTKERRGEGTTRECNYPGGWAGGMKGPKGCRLASRRLADPPPRTFPDPPRPPGGANLTQPNPSLSAAPWEGLQWFGGQVGRQGGGERVRREVDVLVARVRCHRQLRGNRGAFKIGAV